MQKDTYGQSSSFISLIFQWCRRGGMWTVVGLVVALTASAAQAQSTPYQITTTTWGYRPLEHGNGNKIARGFGNTLHTTWQNGGVIYYSTSNNGTSWSLPAPLSGSGASQPTIAVAANGTIGIVWVALDGSLMYASRPLSASSWSVLTLGFGKEPSLAAHGLVMYLAWNVNDVTIRYASFPATGPVGGLPFETVSSAGCSQKTTKPSIGLVKILSNPLLVRVGYLVTSACTSPAQTTAGPVVRQRASTGGWSTLFSNLSSSSSNIAPAAVSLSLSTNVGTGDTFLAWSDSHAGVSRTRLAKGAGPAGTLWQALTLSNTRRHVHVRAASSALEPPTMFRLAWTAAGSSGDPFFGASTFLDTATWPGPAPVWIGAVNLGLEGAGRPQSMFWRKCITPFTAPVVSELSAYYEAKNGANQSIIAVNQHSWSPCPLPVLQSARAPIEAPSVGFAQWSNGVQRGSATVVDVGELGVITQLSPGSATVTAPDGKLATVLWSSGTVSSSSETSLVLTSPRADVRVISAELTFELHEFGYLAEYDGPFVGGPAF